jgi:hypothetical protein
MKKKQTKKMPPKGPGGTPKPDRKKKETAAPAMSPGDAQRQFALRQCYAGMRTMGHAPLVALAMMNEISNGYELSDIEDAVKAYGDLK